MALGRWRPAVVAAAVLLLLVVGLQRVPVARPAVVRGQLDRHRGGRHAG